METKKTYTDYVCMRIVYHQTVVIRFQRRNKIAVFTNLQIIAIRQKL